MTRRFVLLVLASTLLLPVALAPTPAAAAPCAPATFTSLGLPDTTITSAAVQPAGPFTPPGSTTPIPNLPAFCRVTGTLTPSPVSNIKIEVWMPATGWNGRLQGVGNGGLAGVISYSALGLAIQGGYATVSTDTGHVSSDTTWLPIQDKEKDYAFRAIHGMTVTAKALVNAFYGSAAQRSYFNGCSTGGGQGFGEVQLYPEDYDGILAGAPQDFPTHLRANFIWILQAGDNDPASNLPATTLSLITTAVLTQCGGPDGLADGFLANPQLCHFNPKELLCQSGQDPTTCLTAPQVEAVEKVYAGSRDPRTHELIWPGLLRGSELPAGAPGWLSAGINGPPFSTADLFYRYAVFENPNFDLHAMNFDSDVELADLKFPYLNHIDTDIEPFTRRGGKLLIYHGWADPLITPQNTINYFGSVVAAGQRRHHHDNGKALRETQESLRLFLVPGMGHCSGGPGPDHFDALGALVTWVEQGKAPEQIIASHVTSGKVTFSRPLCPYPQEAQFTGTGDRSDATNWTCVPGPFIFDPDFYEDGMNIYGNDHDRDNRGR